MWLKSFAAVGLFFVAIAGCTFKSEVPNDPKKVLNEYISLSFSIKAPADRQQLLDYLTRDAKSRLSAWSDDQFREAFIDSKRDFVKLLFTETKPVGDSEVSITYELSYIDKNKGHDAKVTQKKLAQMIKDQGRWQISDVQSIKQLVEYRNEMSLP